MKIKMAMMKIGRWLIRMAGLCDCLVVDCTTDDGYTVTCTRCGRKYRLARKVVSRRKSYQEALRDAGFYAGGYVSDGHKIVRILNQNIL
jgi:hypothetical protein